jgi:AmmeMemoRadiSam system protein A
VDSLILDADDRRTLLQLAREAIRARLAPGPRHDAVAPGTRYPAPGTGAALSRPCPAFVTLRRGDQLRGCIGHVEADRPLADVVARAAVAAALEDPRFPPVTAVELDEISIEISVLGPMQAVTDPSTIDVGRHGLVVHSGMSRGLLLPQVPTELGWDRQTFLEHLCVKAGLPRGAWRTAELFAFEAEVFSDQVRSTKFDR